VLILEVARFKYPPHWVPLDLLFDAMKVLMQPPLLVKLSYHAAQKEIDKVTSLTRGYITLRSSQLAGANQLVNRRKEVQLK